MTVGSIDVLLQKFSSAMASKACGLATIRWVKVNCEREIRVAGKIMKM